MVIHNIVVEEVDVTSVTTVVDIAKVLGLQALDQCQVLVDGEHLPVVVTVHAVTQVEWA
tara:strand:- start:59 stop:235 length:177 start_codon:yes stop_codon:yes gene_type:complete